MNVIIFDKSGDSDPSGVGVIYQSPNWKGTLDELFADMVSKNQVLNVAYEIVNEDILPYDKPMELWIWE